MKGLRAVGLVVCLAGLAAAASAQPNTLSFKRISTEDGLSQSAVYALVQDPSGFLWIGTQDGLNRYDGYRFTVFQQDDLDTRSLSSNWIAALHVDQRSALWVGTNGGGLNRFDPRTQQFTRYRHRSDDPNSLAHDVVTAIHEDHHGFLWIGTYGGLSRFDSQTKHFQTYRPDPNDPNSLRAPRALVLAEDPGGALWVGTDTGGLNRLDPATGRVTAYLNDPGDPNSLSANVVLALHVDRDSALWVGTTDGGLNRFDPATERVTRYRHDPGDPASLSQDIVASIHEDRTGTLWIGTGAGLNRLHRETDTFTRFTQRDGLPNNTIYGILEDIGGNLWLSTNKGLSHFDPTTGTFLNYDAGDGLQSNEFSQGAYYQSPSGDLFFGGINGFNRFHPDALRNTALAAVVLTSFGAGHEAARLHPTGRTTVTLAQQNAFSFEFAVLDFANPAKNRYAFKLEGLDADWHYRDADQRFAAYSNLAGGTYTLRVKGANADGVWNNEGVRLTVTIVPPFWETAWFRLLLALVCLGVVGSLAYTWHRIRIRLKVTSAPQQGTTVQVVVPRPPFSPDPAP